MTTNRQCKISLDKLPPLKISISNLSKVTQQVRKTPEPPSLTSLMKTTSKLNLIKGAKTLKPIPEK